MGKILILGAAGMLGHKLCQRLSGRDLSGYEVVATVRKDAAFYAQFPEVFESVRLIGGVDALDHDRLAGLLKDVSPDVVINCIGIVKQLDAAKNAFLSVAINSYLPHWLAMRCGELGCRLVHVSTDCVFDGVDGGYTEAHESNARDFYGRSKFLGETAEEVTSAITLRSSIIGRELQKPYHGLLEWFFGQSSHRVRGFANAIYSGFTTIEMARIIRLVIDDHPGLHGVYHVASEPINKCDLLCLVRDICGLDVDIERDEEFFCDRSLRMDRFEEAASYVAPSWEQMIRELHEDPTPYSEWGS